MRVWDGIIHCKQKQQSLDDVVKKGDWSEGKSKN